MMKNDGKIKLITGEVSPVTDGNNLRYLLYRNCPATFHAFGGDYDKVIMIR